MTNDIDWKAHAEAAEARAVLLEAALDVTNKKTGGHHSGAYLCAAIDENNARIAELEAHLARVPSREEVARSLARSDGYSAEWCDRALEPGTPEAECFMRHLVAADAVLDLFAAVRALGESTTENNPRINGDDWISRELL